MKLSVVIPVYNEEKTVYELLGRVVNAPLGELELEIVLTDDASTDGSLEEVKRFQRDNPDVEMRIFSHRKNRGKGASVTNCFNYVTGDIVIVQDADLEYDPNEYPVVLGPILDGRADVVYGSRFQAGPRRVLYYWHSVGNRVITTLSNMFTNLNLTDIETCYKAFRAEVLESFTVKSQRFGIEPEITAKIAKRGYRIYEVPISYAGRTYQEGKKIGWVDALKALYCIVKFRFVE